MSFSFGSPSSAPASSGLTGGFSFGANKPAATGFGTPAAQPSTGLFGSTTASTTPAFGATTPGFGANTTFGGAQSAFGSTAPAFGATSTPGFGAAVAPTFGAGATPGFGATSAPSFGAPSAAPAFGAAAPTFGATSTAPTFGASATPAFGATSTAPTFGASATPAFGATSTAPAFGSTATPAFGAGGAGFGTGGLNFNTGTSTAGTGLTLGAPVASSAGGLGLGFGTTTTQSAGLGGFFNTSTANTGLFGNKLGTTPASSLPSAAPSLGLGGAAPATGAGSSQDGKSEPPKQQKLPNEIQSTVDSFKEFAKKQKSLSSDIMKVSIKPLHKVSTEAEALCRAALSLGGEVSRARAHSRRLRALAAAALATAETQHTHSGVELDGNAPPVYVKELIAELEQQLITFRRQMDVADKQMQATPKLLTEQELTLGIRRMHESLVALAARLQAATGQVRAHKEQYLNLRKYILKDPTNVFEVPDTCTSLDQILREAEGTRKKAKGNTCSTPNVSSAVLSDPIAALGNIQQLAGPTPFSYIGSTMSPYTVAETTGANWLSIGAGVGASTGVGAGRDALQLQRPPGKRGKQ